MNIVARIVASHWMPYELAVLVSHGVGMLTAYTLTRLFVFETSGRTTTSELSRFALVNVLSAAITWCVSVGLVDVIFPAISFRTQPELVGHVIGLGVSSVASFVGHSRFSFARR